MKTTEEKNVIIADFMGLKNPYELPQHGTIRPNGYFKTEFTASQLRYSLSWDWLMPVIKKIFRLYSWNHLFGDLKESLMVCDIERAFEKSVEFIQWDNEYKATQKN